MLNWRVEEEKYVRKKKDEYLDSLSSLNILFTSQKTRHENLLLIEERARMSYREQKLDSMLDEIRKERDRINDLVHDINNKFSNNLQEQMCIINEKIKPLEINVRPYHDYTQIDELEVVEIELKPLKIYFVQQKIGEWE